MSRQNLTTGDEDIIKYVPAQVLVWLVDRGVSGCCKSSSTLAGPGSQGLAFEGGQSFLTRFLTDAETVSRTAPISGDRPLPFRTATHRPLVVPVVGTPGRANFQRWVTSFGFGVPSHLWSVALNSAICWICRSGLAF